MIELRGNLWVPKDDYHCFNAIQSERDNIPKMISYCRGKDLVVQAGGNIGVFPIDFSRHFNKVVTFEPDAENFECLTRNIGSNPKIEAHRNGLGDRHESVEMKREIDNCGAYYVDGYGGIEIVRIDDFLLPACDLIQLDVEGYELKALKGALGTIRVFHPTIVTEEKGLGKRYGIEDDAISSLLLGLDYKISDKIGRDVIYTWEGTNG